MNNTCKTTDRSINQLTNELLEDLQNPTLGPLELCQLHNLTLPELAAILESESYQQAVECIERITTARDKLLEPQSKSLAKARLTDLLKTYPETESQQETQRKAATTLLRSTLPPSPSGRGQGEGSFSSPASSTLLPQASGGGVAQRRRGSSSRVPRLDRTRQAVASEGLQGKLPLHSHTSSSPSLSFPGEHMARKAKPERAFRPWAISMCIAAMHWGNLMGMLGHLTIHDGQLLILTKRYGKITYLEMPTGHAISYAILSVLGWLSIPVMLVSMIYIRDMFEYKNERFKKYAGVAFLCALGAFILGILIGNFFKDYTTLYSP